MTADAGQWALCRPVRFWASAILRRERTVIEFLLALAITALSAAFAFFVVYDACFLEDRDEVDYVEFTGDCVSADRGSRADLRGEDREVAI